MRVTPFVAGMLSSLRSCGKLKGGKVSRFEVRGSRLGREDTKEMDDG